jgi:hypothetical protein
VVHIRATNGERERERDKREESRETLVNSKEREIVERRNQTQKRLKDLKEVNHNVG